jgi:hypothetical protein
MNELDLYLAPAYGERVVSAETSGVEDAMFGIADFPPIGLTTIFGWNR